MSNSLTFVSFKPESFAGINQQNAKDLVIFFPDDKPIIGFKGDQGTGKSSSLACIHYLLGGIEPKNSINTDDADRKGELVFIDGEGRKHVSKCTKTGFTVTLVQESDGKEVKSVIKSPRNYLQDLIGSVSLSPMELKEKKGAEQIQWIRENFSVSEEQQKLEADINKKREEAYNTRTDINRDVKRLYDDMCKTDLYRWDEENKVFLETPALKEEQKEIAANNFNDEEIAVRFEESKKKFTQFLNAGTEVRNLKDSLPQKESNLTYWEKQLEEAQIALNKAKEDLKNVNDRIEAGEKWIKENSKIEEDYTAAQTLLQNSGNIKLKKERLSNLSKVHNAYNIKVEEQIAINGKLDEIDALKKEFIKEVTPDIPGLEIYLAGMDPKKEEGLYYKGRSMYECSESELWELYLQLLEKKGSKVILIEDITRFGTEAVNVMNRFAENGGKIFFSEMKRGLKNISLEFHNEIPK